MLSYDFLENSLGIASPPYSVYDFSGKMFLVFYSINCLNFIISCLYFLRYWAICVLQLLFPGCDFKNFKTNLSNQAVSLRPKCQDKNLNV